MSLNVSTTVTDITTAIDALPATATENQKMTALINALYNRIKSDMVVTSQIPSGAITTTGSATTQTGPAAPVSVTSTGIS